MGSPGGGHTQGCSGPPPPTPSSRKRRAGSPFRPQKGNGVPGPEHLGVARGGRGPWGVTECPWGVTEHPEVPRASRSSLRPCGPCGVTACPQSVTEQPPALQAPWCHLSPIAIPVSPWGHPHFPLGSPPFPLGATPFPNGDTHSLLPPPTPPPILTPFPFCVPPRLAGGVLQTLVALRGRHQRSLPQQ